MSTTHPKQDLSKSEGDLPIAMKILEMQRKQLILVGIDLRRHIVDMVV